VSSHGIHSRIELTGRKKEEHDSKGERVSGDSIFSISFSAFLRYNSGVIF
jgi:hypothetical protein